MEVKVGLVGERVFRQAGHNKSKALVGENHAETRARESQDQRFGEKLADDANRAGSHRGADRKFMLAGGASGQQQDGDIAASNRQEQTHGAKEQIESRPD